MMLEQYLLTMRYVEDVRSKLEEDFAFMDYQPVFNKEAPQGINESKWVS